MEWPTNDKGDKRRQQQRVAVSHIAAMREWENNPNRFYLQPWEQRRERCDWVQSPLVCGCLKHIAFFFLWIIALCLFVWFTFPPFSIYLCLRERHHGEIPFLTPWKRHSQSHLEHDVEAQTVFSCFWQLPLWTLIQCFSLKLPDFYGFWSLKDVFL